MPRKGRLPDPAANASVRHRAAAPGRRLAFLENQPSRFSLPLLHARGGSAEEREAPDRRQAAQVRRPCDRRDQENRQLGHDAAAQPRPVGLRALGGGVRPRDSRTGRGRPLERQHADACSCSTEPVPVLLLLRPPARRQPGFSSARSSFAEARRRLEPPAATIRWRNCSVRGSRGAVKICSGSPCSRITPSSRKQTRLAMSRAKDISCVAMSIVIPPSASSRMTLSTSATSSGSSALVTSSRSMSSGCSASAGRWRRAAAGRRRAGPGSRRPVGQPEAGEQLERLRLGLRSRRPERLRRPERDVPEHGHVREEVVRLEDDPDAPPHAVEVHARRGDLVAAEDDPALVHGSSRFTQRRSVDLPEPDAPITQTTSCCASSRSTPSAPRGRRRTCGCPRGGAPAARSRHPARGSCRRRSRATSQSVSRASGIVSAMKRSAVTR